MYHSVRLGILIDIGQILHLVQHVISQVFFIWPNLKNLPGSFGKREWARACQRSTLTSLCWRIGNLCKIITLTFANLGNPWRLGIHMSIDYGLVYLCLIMLCQLFWNLTRPLPFSDKRSVPACYHGGNISTLDSDSDVHRSLRNKWLKPWEPGNISLFGGINFFSVHAICEKW